MTSIYDKYVEKGVQEFGLEKQIVPASVLREIYYFLRRNGYWSASEEKFQEHCIAAIGVDWVASEGEYTGKFTKRLSKWYYEKSGRWAAYNELPDDAISYIGNLIGKAKPPTDIYWDVPKDNWSWDLTKFSHASSCFRPGSMYQNLPFIFNQEGIFSIRFYDKVGEDAYSPIGRVWVRYFEQEEHPFYVIFNGYGYNLSIIAYFMSHQFNLPEVKKIKVLNKGVWDGEVWINEGNGYALSDTSFNFEKDTYDLNISANSYQKTCRNCGASFIPNFLNQKVSESFRRTVVSIKRGLNLGNPNASFKTYIEDKSFCSQCYTEGNFWESSVYGANLYIDYAAAYFYESTLSDQGWDQNTLIKISDPRFFVDVREAFTWAKENVGEEEAYLDSEFLEKLYNEFKRGGVTYFYGVDLLRLGFTTNVRGRSGFVSYKDIQYLYISQTIMKKFTGTNSDRFTKFSLSNSFSNQRGLERSFPGAYYFAGENIFKVTECYYTKLYFPRYQCLYGPDGHWYSEYGFKKAIGEGYFKGLLDLLELNAGSSMNLNINILYYKKNSEKSSVYTRTKQLETMPISFVEYLANYFKKGKFITQGVSL